MCYLFEGDITPRDEHGVTNSTESEGLEPRDDDAVHVRTISGKLLVRIPEGGDACLGTVRDIVRSIEDCTGLASQVKILATNGLLKMSEPIYPLLSPGECLTLTVIFAPKPSKLDAEGREYPYLADVLDCGQLLDPAVLSIDEAIDQEPWPR